MRRSALVITLSVVCSLAAAASLPANAASTSSPPCTPKKASLHGQTIYYLCGPATATLSVGGKAYAFRNGYGEPNGRNPGRAGLRP